MLSRGLWSDSTLGLFSINILMKAVENKLPHPIALSLSAHSGFPHQLRLLRHKQLAVATEHQGLIVKHHKR